MPTRPPPKHLNIFEFAPPKRGGGGGGVTFRVDDRPPGGRLILNACRGEAGERKATVRAARGVRPPLARERGDPAETPPRRIRQKNSWAWQLLSRWNPPSPQPPLPRARTSLPLPLAHNRPLDLQGEEHRNVGQFIGGGHRGETTPARRCCRGGDVGGVGGGAAAGAAGVVAIVSARPGQRRAAVDVGGGSHVQRRGNGRMVRFENQSQKKTCMIVDPAGMNSLTWQSFFFPDRSARDWFTEGGEAPGIFFSVLYIYIELYYTSIQSLYEIRPSLDPTT